MPIFGCRGGIYKYDVNPVNNIKVCPPRYDYEGATRDNTQNSRRTDAAKRDSTVSTCDGNKRAPANQCLKKLGMCFLKKPDMKAADIFPKGFAQLVCVDFTCNDRECSTRENCTFVHPRKVGDLKKETVNAIGKHFLEKKLAGSTSGIS